MIPSPHAPAGLATAAAKLSRRSASVLAALLVIAYMLLWWNRFLGVTTEGWFALFARRFLDGAVPYRDFYLYAPPLHALKIAGLFSLFGDLLLPLRICGVLERGLMAAVLCAWLSRFYPPLASLLAAVTTLAVFSGDTAETVSFYNHDAALLSLVAAYCAGLALDAERPRRIAALAFAAGSCAGLALCAKQTLGLGMTMAIPFAFFVLGRGPLKRRALAPAWFAAGWIVPISAVVLWLRSIGAFGAFVEQVFVVGPSSKGPLLGTLLRPVLAPIFIGGMRNAAVVALLAVGLTIAALRRNARPIEQDGEAGSLRRTLWLVATLSFGAFVLVSIAQSPNLRFPQTVAIYVGVLGSLAILVVGLKNLRTGEPAARGVVFLALISLSTAYLHAVSWPAFELMVLPALGLVIAQGLASAAAMGPRRLLYPVLVAASIAWIAFSVRFKLEAPYSWGGWQEPPIASGTVPSKLPELRGLRLSPTTTAAVERMVATLEQHSTPADTVFVFPDLPILYWLAHRLPPTFAYVHWFDVAPDRLAVDDARRVFDARPAVLISLELSPGDFLVHEAIFRAGKPSGQRRIFEALHTLVEKGYTELEPVRLPTNGTLIRLWVRDDRLAVDPAPSSATR